MRVTPHRLRPLDEAGRLKVGGDGRAVHVRHDVARHQTGLLPDRALPQHLHPRADAGLVLVGTALDRDALQRCECRSEEGQAGRGGGYWARTSLVSRPFGLGTLIETCMFVRPRETRFATKKTCAARCDNAADTQNIISSCLRHMVRQLV